MCYALGALELFDGIYDINSIQMTIFPSQDVRTSAPTVLQKENCSNW